MQTPKAQTSAQPRRPSCRRQNDNSAMAIHILSGLPPSSRPHSWCNPSPLSSLQSHPKPFPSPPSHNRRSNRLRKLPPHNAPSLRQSCRRLPRLHRPHCRPTLLLHLSRLSSLSSLFHLPSCRRLRRLSHSRPTCRQSHSAYPSTPSSQTGRTTATYAKTSPKKNPLVTQYARAAARTHRCPAAAREKGSAWTRRGTTLEDGRFVGA